MGPSAKVRAVNMAANVARAMAGNRTAGSAVSMSASPKLRMTARVAATSPPSADVKVAVGSSFADQEDDVGHVRGLRYLKYHCDRYRDDASNCNARDRRPSSFSRCQLDRQQLT
jgi:hypothetical protein